MNKIIKEKIEEFVRVWLSYNSSIKNVGYKRTRTFLTKALEESFKAGLKETMIMVDKESSKAFVKDSEFHKVREAIYQKGFKAGKEEMRDKVMKCKGAKALCHDDCEVCSKP